MKVCIATLFSFSIIVGSATAIAGENSGVSWQDDGITIAFHPDDLPQVKSRPAEEPEQAQFAVIGEIPETGNRGSLEYSGFVDANARSGELLIGTSAMPSSISFRWDLGLSAPRITLETANSKVSYPLVPVILPATSEFHNHPAMDLEALFPEHYQELSAVLNSPDLARVIPKTLINGMQADRRSEMNLGEPSAGTQDFGEWSCGLSCGAAIGLGLFDVVSAGLLTPGAAATAAYCGSCMGYIWGNHVTSQPPVNIPADGGGAPIGSFLPPLPPGWAWTCFANNSGGYTCVAEETGISTIPY